MPAESNSSFTKKVFLYVFNCSRLILKFLILVLRHFYRFLAFLTKLVPQSLKFLFKSVSRQLNIFSFINWFTRNSDLKKNKGLYSLF